MITLQNEILYAAIAPHGAELQQLKNKQTGLQYLWSGDANYWGKYSPVLFPIVGGLKENIFFYDQKKYSLPRHGFARDALFIAEQLSDTEAVFTLTDNAMTQAVYPFAFTLQLRYQIVGDTMSCTYTVTNSGNKVMLFSIGAHPAFALPLESHLDYTDYYLAFNKPEKLTRWKLDKGLLSDRTESLPMHNNRLLLSSALFYADAIVLKALQSNCITLASDKSAHGLHFYFHDFPFFGIWAAKDAPFICLEPWCGIADNVNSTQQFQHKEGIETLAPAKDFIRQWRVECF